MSIMKLITRDPPASSLTKATIGTYSCVKYDPNVTPAINYDPNLVAGIIFCVAFGLIFVGHTYQVFRSKKWFYLSFSLGALGELIGWAARAHMHYCPYNKTMFTLQIAILIISPCFYTAALYYILGELIRLWGPEYSALSPRLYLYIFISFDLVSIAVQGAGGGIASKIQESDHTTGAHIMLAGIIVQLVAMFSFIFLGTLTIWRARQLTWGFRLRTLILTTALSTVCIITRNLYRAVELGQGWSGYLISHEVYFCVLDGALMVLAPLVFNFIHPASWLKPAQTPNTSRFKLEAEHSTA